MGKFLHWHVQNVFCYYHGMLVNKKNAFSGPKIVYSEFVNLCCSSFLKHLSNFWLIFFLTMWQLYQKFHCIDEIRHWSSGCFPMPFFYSLFIFLPRSPCPSWPFLPSPQVKTRPSMVSVITWVPLTDTCWIKDLANIKICMYYCKL